MSIKKKLFKFLIVASTLLVAGVLHLGNLNDGQQEAFLTFTDDAVAAEKVSPTKARARDYYAPNSEDLASDEMRVIACGTGMPTTRAAQAAACFLVELGNGDKFIFDIGSGSAERLSSLQIP